jgi:hypothetical protein
MTQFFQFEMDFVDSLRCIPMSVRMKLDTCGIKLKLHQWNQFNQEARQNLVDFPCESITEIQSYRDFLVNLITETTEETAKELTIDPQPPWLNISEIPTAVLTQAEGLNVQISLENWQSLSPLQRFALIKLSLSHHENSNFLPALKEFNVL